MHLGFVDPCCVACTLFEAAPVSCARSQVREQCRGEPQYEAIGSLRAKERLFRTYQDTLAQLEALTRQRSERAQAGYRVRAGSLMLFHSGSVSANLILTLPLGPFARGHFPFSAENYTATTCKSSFQRGC